ncbi:hypothetical protein DL96DRAFT_146274 [Flagelloscypha sp. PMI_526]|nr:hypothetical protein DL96DRAFT_146274 [Flagelloscypha sp. PMI_526]
MELMAVSPYVKNWMDAMFYSCISLDLDHPIELTSLVTTFRRTPALARHVRQLAVKCPSFTSFDQLLSLPHMIVARRRRQEDIASTLSGAVIDIFTLCKKVQRLDVENIPTLFFSSILGNLGQLPVLSCMSFRNCHVPQFLSSPLVPHKSILKLQFDSYLPSVEILSMFPNLNQVVSRRHCFFVSGNTPEEVQRLSDEISNAVTIYLCPDELHLEEVDEEELAEMFRNSNVIIRSPEQAVGWMFDW